jgi:serine/threonine protein phosphatase 1
MPWLWPQLAGGDDPPPAAPPPTGRLIIIGDIHGCADELEALLNRLSPRQTDTLVAVGDLVNRGPDSARVLQIVRRTGMRSVVGNHERRLLKAYRKARAAELKPSDLQTYNQFGLRDWQDLEALPLTLEYPEHNALIVHGGFMPGRPWSKQPAEIVTELQVITAHGLPARRNKAPNAQPWADFWNGPECVYYGHTPRSEPLIHRHAIGLDTGCVYGGALTACVLPGQLIVQVPAREPYVGR